MSKLSEQVAKAIEQFAQEETRKERYRVAVAKLLATDPKPSKIQRLMGEGYSQEAAIAIAYAEDRGKLA